MGTLNVVVLDPHRHAILDLELTLRQPGLVNSFLHTLRHIVNGHLEKQPFHFDGRHSDNCYQYPKSLFGELVSFLLLASGFYFSVLFTSEGFSCIFFCKFFPN